MDLSPWRTSGLMGLPQGDLSARPRRGVPDGTQFARWTVVRELAAHTSRSQKRRFWVRCWCGYEAALAHNRLLKATQDPLMGCTQKRCRALYARYSQLAAYDPALVDFVATIRGAVLEAGPRDATLKALGLVIAAAEIKQHLDGITRAPVALPARIRLRRGTLELAWQFAAQAAGAPLATLAIEVHEDGTWDWFASLAKGAPQASKEPLRGVEAPSSFRKVLSRLFG